MEVCVCIDSCTYACKQLIEEVKIELTKTYVYIYIYTHPHPSIHACIHTYIHASKHACMHACMHACIKKGFSSISNVPESPVQSLNTPAPPRLEAFGGTKTTPLQSCKSAFFMIEARTPIPGNAPNHEAPGLLFLRLG